MISISNPTPNEKLYHYCPSNSFFGIATSRVLWLSNSWYTNDPNENKLAYTILRDIANDIPPNDISRFAKSVLEQRFGPVDSMSSYVFCMSENSDDLNQWRVYADNGYGFMLGLRPHYFLQKGLWTLLESGSSFPAIDCLYLSKCIYDSAQQRSIVTSLLQQFQGQGNPDHPDNIVKLRLYLKYLSGVFKHHSYSAENEWRVLCFPLTQQQAHEPLGRFKTLFRSGRGLVIQYTQQDYNQGATPQDPPLDSVVLGPNVLNDPFEISSFLMFQGVRFRRVSKSELMLREL